MARCSHHQSWEPGRLGGGWWGSHCCPLAVLQQLTNHSCAHVRMCALVRWCSRVLRGGFADESSCCVSSSLKVGSLKQWNATMAEEATCSVCAENYDAFVRCPRVLRCGHSLCQSCLSRIIRVPAVKACPECRFAIKPNRAADFPKNFALLQLLPANPAEPVAAPCANTGCGGGAAAVPANDGAQRRKRSRSSGRRRRGRGSDPLRDRVRAWYLAHCDWQNCGCEACVEWAHGIQCRCSECEQ